MKQEQICIRTLDDDCPGLVATPDGDGLWPAVIVCMDGLGMRPALAAMAARLADSGYVVLLPDLFTRFGSDAALDPEPVLAGDFPAIVGPPMTTTDNRKAAADTEALLADLDTPRDVAGSKVGIVGLCRGGGTALTEAGAFLTASRSRQVPMAALSRPTHRPARISWRRGSSPRSMLPVPTMTAVIHRIWRSGATWHSAMPA